MLDKVHHPSYMVNLGGIVTEEHEFWVIEVLLIHSYGNFGQSFMTMCMRRCLLRD